jgi:hypothetical protein
VLPFSNPSEKMMRGTTFTEALAGGEGQPAEFVSLTVRVSVPVPPTVNVTWFVPFPAVIVPLVIDQEYVLPV